eukprot:9761066-Alexandrium_andersonii.AAC.1
MDPSQPAGRGPPGGWPHRKVAPEDLGAMPGSHGALRARSRHRRRKRKSGAQACANDPRAAPTRRRRGDAHAGAKRCFPLG